MKDAKLVHSLPLTTILWLAGLQQEMRAKHDGCSGANVPPHASVRLCDVPPKRPPRSSSAARRRGSYPVTTSYLTQGCCLDRRGAIRGSGCHSSISSSFSCNTEQQAVTCCQVSHVLLIWRVGPAGTRSMMDPTGPAAAPALLAVNRQRARLQTLPGRSPP